MKTMRILLADELDEDGNHHLRRVRDLTDSDFERLAKTLRILAEFSQNYGFYEICRANYDAIVLVHNHVTEAKGLGQDSARYLTTEMNRGFLNLLCSFRAFIDHSERKLKNWDKAEKVWFEIFHDRTSFHYDTNFWYRFFWKLRHYVQHRGLPVAGIEKRLVAVESGGTTVETNVYFSRDDLLRDYGDWGIVKEDLLRQPEKIDVMVGALELISSIDDLSQLVAKIILERIGDEYSFLEGLVIEVSEAYPDPVAVTGQVQIDEVGTVRFTSLESLPLNTMNDISELKRHLLLPGEGFTDEQF
jgi:hypothetical protein